MYSSPTQGYIIFIAITFVLILAMAFFISFIIFRYQQKQNSYYKNMEELRRNHENAMLQSKVEIQEQTFQNISREIHDNIGQKLTLAKLNLNTLELNPDSPAVLKINNSIKLIGESILDLSDISRSMSSETVSNNGLIRAIENEIEQLTKSGIFRISFEMTGDLVFLSAEKELVLFRVVQESINNIIKHASATTICLRLHFKTSSVELEVEDNGKGFLLKDNEHHGLGLSNIKRRADILHGTSRIISSPGRGTTIIIEIPYT